MLFGRESETAALDLLLADARAGRSGACCLRGEAGIGKSALLTFARERAGHEMLVLETIGVESEAELPFAGVAQIVAPIVHRLDAIPPPQAAALRSALALGPPSPGDRFAAYAATLSLLLATAADRALLIAVDDAHWLDDSSRETLLFVVRRLGADAIAVVVTSRDGEPNTPEIRDAFEDIQVAGLDPTAARRLLRRSGAPELTERVAEVIVAGAGGNPLALIEVPPLLTAAQRTGAAPLEQPLPAGQSIARAFVRRARRIPTDGRRALVVAASSDDGRIDAIRAALAPLGLELEDLVTAEEAGLVEVGDGVVRFVHPLARSALYHDADLAERRSAHRALALALEHDPARAAQRAWQLARAALGSDEEAAVALEAVGREALARTSYAAAASALSRAASLSVDPAAGMRRTLAAAAAATVSGQPEVAIALLTPLAAATTRTVPHAEAHELLGMALMFQGRIAEAAPMLERAADALVELDPERSATMFVVVGAIRAMQANLPDALRFGRRAELLAHEQGRPAQFPSDTLLGYGLCLAGDVAAAQPYVTRAMTVLQRLDSLSPTEGASFPLVLPMLVFPIVWLGRYEEAHQTIDGLVHACRMTGGVSMLPMLLALRADVLTREGRLAEALDAGRESLTISGELRQEVMGASALTMLARVEALTGRDTECRAHAERAIELAHATGARSIAIYAAAALGMLGLGNADSMLALEQLRRAAGLAETNGLGHPGVVVYLAEAVEAHARAGHDDEAVERLQVLEHMVGRTGHPGSRGTLERCRGLLAGDDEFREHLERAIALSETAGERLEAARSRLALGARLRRARRRGDARPYLEAARSAFEQMGARPWQAQAEEELRAAGVARYRAPVADVPGLTAQELQVALRVARGATNRETAADMFVSAKTVEFHLGRVYRKLGIRSRAELAALVASGAIEAGSSQAGDLP